MALIAARAAGRRKDWAEKISTRLVRDHDVIVLEKLSITGMTRRPAPRPDPGQPGTFLQNQSRSKAGLSRGILASCWGALARRITAKAEVSGVSVVLVDPRFTSQQCHACGHTDPANRDSQAVFACTACGHRDHADANAARNILARGLALAAGEPVPAPAPGHGAYARVSLPRQRREPPGLWREPPWESSSLQTRRMSMTGVDVAVCQPCELWSSTATR
jgi:transposase